MKKLLPLMLSLLTTSSLCYSQTLDQAEIEVYYRYEMVNDRLKPERKGKDEVLLLIGEKYTHYYSYMNYLRDSLIEANPAEYRSQVATSDGKILTPKPGETTEEIQARGGTTIIPPRARLKTNTYNKEHYFINRTSGELLCLNPVLNAQNPQINYCSYTERLQSPQWKIGTATDTIAGYRSQKATAHYGGRDWTVWFTPEIPVGEGPWKLRGLPGLILKAETADGEFFITATSVSRSSHRSIAKSEKKVYRNLPKKEVFQLKKEGFRHPRRPVEYNDIEILKD